MKTTIKVSLMNEYDGFAKLEIYSNNHTFTVGEQITYHGQIYKVSEIDEDLEVAYINKVSTTSPLYSAIKQRVEVEVN